MTTDTNNPGLFDGIRLDATAVRHLRSLAGWAMLTVVVAFGGYALSIMEMLPGTQELVRRDKFDFKINTEGYDLAISIAALVVGIALNILLLRFALLVKTGTSQNDEGKIAAGLTSLKWYFLICTLGLIAMIIIIIASAVLVKAAT